jgi:membrane-bound ClpP family serine protease
MINNPLTNRQQDICSYTGLFGVLITLTCLIQHMAITKAHWITFTMLGIYLFIIMAFVLLGLQKSMSPLLLIIAAALSLIAELILTISGIFSLAVLLLLLYTVIIVISLYAEQIPRLLKQKALEIKVEEDLWKDKI